MFRYLHNKYLVLNIIVLTLILAAVLVFVNVDVQKTQDENTQTLLTLILRTGGDPERSLAESSRAEDAGEDLLDTASSDYYKLKTSSYFLVRTAGAVISAADVRHAVELSEEQATALCTVAIGKAQDSGRVGRYAYKCQIGPTGSVYAFVDVSAVLRARSQLLVASVAAGVIAEALLLVFVSYVAARQIRPAEQLLEASRDIMEKGAADMTAGAAFLVSAYRDRGSAHASPALREGVVLSGIAADLRGVAAAAERTGHPRPVDLSTVLLETAQESRLRWDQKDLRLHTAVEENVVLRAYPDEIRALLEILMVNVGENAAPGGDIMLDLLTDRHNIGVIVRYAVEELPAVTPDAVLSGERSRNSGFGGGLYAARLLAQLNRGDLTCEYLDPPAVCFTLRFRRPLLSGRDRSRTA